MGALDGLREAEAGEPLEPLRVAVEAPGDDVASGLADLPSHLAVGPGRLDDERRRHGRHPTPSQRRFGPRGCGNAVAMDGDRDFRFSPRPNRAAEIRWRPWGEPAFAEARRLGRPVLLSLSAVWCHWCHVMDETSYSDPRVIAAVNEHFVPIRVDNDRHPDVNRRYNMGGWPTTAFLAASGDVLTGGTYLPPDQMLESLARVKAFFDANQAKILALEGERASDGDGAAMARLTGLPLDGELALDALEGDPDVPGDISAEVALQVVRGFDPLHGGLGAEPKFPQPDVFGFMLAYGLLRGAGDPEHVPEGGSALLRPARVHEVVRDDAHGHGERRAVRRRRGRLLPLRHAARLERAPLREDARGQRPAGLAVPGGLAARARSTTSATRSCTGAPARAPIDYLLATLWRDDVPGLRRQPGRGREVLPAGRRRPGGPAGAVRGPDRLRGLERAGGAGPAPGGVRARAPGARRPRRCSCSTTCATKARHGDAMAHFVHAGRRASATARRCWATRRRWPRRCSTRTRSPASGAGCDAPAASPAGRASTCARPTAACVDRVAVPGESAGLLAQPVPALDENAAMAEVLLRLEAYTGEARLREQALEILAGWAPFYEQYGVAAAAYGQALLRYLERPDQIVVVGAPRRRRGAAAARRRARPRRARCAPCSGSTRRTRSTPSGCARPACPTSRAAAAYVCRGRTCSLFRP